MSPTTSKGSPLCRLPRRFLSLGIVRGTSTFNGRWHFGQVYDNMSLALSLWRETFTGLLRDHYSARLRISYKEDVRQVCSSKASAPSIWLLRTLLAALLWCRQQVSIPYLTTSSSQKSSTQQANYRGRSIFESKVRHSRKRKAIPLLRCTDDQIWIYAELAMSLITLQCSSRLDLSTSLSVL
jgi:hypothetical protein